MAWRNGDFCGFFPLTGPFSIIAGHLRVELEVQAELVVEGLDEQGGAVEVLASLEQKEKVPVKFWITSGSGLDGPPWDPDRRPEPPFPHA